MKWARSWSRGWKGKVRGSAGLSPVAPVACPSLEALCRVLCQCSALGARTGRALRNGLHAERERSIGSAIGEGPSGGLAREIAFALPEGVHSPKVPRHWHCIGFAFSMCAAVLQCAPRARTKGRVMLRIRQSASKNAQATGAERERPCASRMPFPHQRLGFASHKAKRFQRHAGHGRGQGKVCDHHSPFPRARSKGHAAPTASPTMANNHASCKGYDPQTHPPPPRGKTRDNCGRAGSDTHLP